MRSKKQNAEPVVVKQKTISGNWRTQLGYYLMFGIPAIWIIIDHYLPMVGIYMAFTDFKPAKGIFGSKFVGLENFKRFFGSVDFTRMLRNTVLYNIAGVALVSLLAGIVLALLLYEIKSKKANKIYHTCMLFPAFLSWTVVSATVLIILHPESGILNAVLGVFGVEPVRWYSEPAYWPVIIMLCNLFKGGGMASIYFYSALLSIDTELFDAASIDGAGRLKQIWHISLPAMSKVFCITLIHSVGSLISSTVSPYYELTFNNGELYDTTLTLGIYLYNGLGGGRYSFTTAVGLFQSVIGLVLVVAANTIIKRIDPESAMF